MDTNKMFDKELTQEQSDEIIKESNDFINNLKEETKDISNVINFPIETEEVSENGEIIESRMMDVLIDPDTGSRKIIGSADNEAVKDSFDEMVKKINEDKDISLDDTPVSEKEIIDYLANGNSDSMLSELSKGTNISLESTRQLLEIVNRKSKGEKFNTYKELPTEIKSIIDNYVATNMSSVGCNISTINNIKRNVADALLDEFINDIHLDRAKNDFARDLEQIYNSSAKEIADSSLEYIEERNKAYREAAMDIEDEAKKNRLLAILDRIDDARSLDELKEFAKTCKIKSIELEKPETRVYNGFLNKYKNSTNNIYDINIARKVLYRHISNDGYTTKDVDAFFIAFCKHVSGYSVDVATDHAFMYYVLYYSALLDGDKSLIFVNNVKEVINNLRERNNYHK